MWWYQLDTISEGGGLLAPRKMFICAIWGLEWQHLFSPSHPRPLEALAGLPASNRIVDERVRSIFVYRAVTRTLCCSGVVAGIAGDNGWCSFFLFFFFLFFFLFFSSFFATVLTRAVAVRQTFHSPWRYPRSAKKPAQKSQDSIISKRRAQA